MPRATDFRLFILGSALVAWLALWQPTLALALGALGLGLARKRAWQAVHQALAVDSPAVLILMLSVALGSALIVAPWPPDDLLRDMVAWAYHYDYRGMYAYSPLIPRYDMYLGFDKAVAWLYRSLPHTMAPHVVQLLLSVLFVGVLTASLLKVLRRHAHRYYLTTVLLALALSTCAIRLQQARPELLMATWALAATLIDAAWQGWLWSGAGLLLAPTYWLAGVYTPALLLAGDKLAFRQRALIMATVFALQVALWHWLSHGAWYASLNDLHAALANRLMAPAESMPVYVLLLNAFTQLLLALALLTGWLNYRTTGWRKFFRKEAGWLLVFGWFLLPNMVRYSDILSGLLALWAARQLRTLSFNFEGLPALRALALVMTLTLSVTWVLSPAPRHLTFQLPATNKPILVQGSLGSVGYRLQYDQPGLVVSPALEVGMTIRPVQALANGLSQGRLSCRALAHYGFGWVVEDKLSYPPACLQLAQISGPYRLWEVVLPRKHTAHNNKDNAHASTRNKS